jgi:hypothetical protein
MAGMTLQSPKAPKTPNCGSTAGGTAAPSQKSLTVPVPTTAKKAKKTKKK